MVTFHTRGPVDMVLPSLEKGFSVKVPPMIRLLNSTKIGCLTLNLKEEMLVDLYYLFVLGVEECMREMPTRSNHGSTYGPSSCSIVPHLSDFPDVPPMMYNLQSVDWATVHPINSWFELLKLISQDKTYDCTSMARGWTYELLSISTLIGESIVAKRVYRDYPVALSHTVTHVDLVELDIFHFDVILEGSDGFVVYCEASRVSLGCVLMENGKVIAYAS
ncbi:hypothetical protein MTR67_012196 [Solanum verrucosum]|uniref:Uncharacterized protein n=1 Tax=Solanum verrucosum TaxID=315347 RepID=A0AAF0Q8H1_SOLVR|nr:hypothetical protein MTR67_012196 [Solanum verrucosum]